MPQRVHRKTTGNVVTLFHGDAPPRSRRASEVSPRRLRGARTLGCLDDCACTTVEPARAGGIAGLGQTDPAVIEREIARLAELYDAARPPVSFSRWAADQGAGALVDEFKAMLRASGALDVIAVLDATPPPPELSPEEKIATFDAPADGGPWALDASGNWFTVTTSAPGSKVVGNIYVPAVHPSVHASTRPCMEDAEERFLTPKFRAANRLTLQADWRALFTKVAPRGAPGEPIGGPRLFEGTASDYEAEGGELYPDLDPRSAQATELWRWWEHGRQPWCIPHGGANVIQFLRVYTDGEGYQRYKEWSQSELAAWHQWRLSVGGYVCPPGELDKSTADAMANQSAKRANLSDGDYTPYWLGAPAGPVDRCDVTSASRRRKNLKKAAVIAGVVVGAVFLGPTIAGALKSAAGGIGAKIGSVTSKIIPKVVQGVNTVATIKAVKEGKVPPPPIALDGTRFVDYASAIGTNLVERELQEQGQELAASERALLEAQMQQQVRALQQSAAAQLPASLRTGYPLSTVSPAVRDAMTSAPPEWIKFAAVGGAALFLAVMLSR